MKIKEIVSQSRRDFTAIYECQLCGHEHEGHGYDDRYFHETVIPKMICQKCDKASSENYVPRATKYPDGQNV